jgi:hypothetical protein
MYVEVEDGLSGARPYIEHRAIPVFDAAIMGDLSGCEMTSANDLSLFERRFFEAANVLLGNDEHVSRRFRINVFKGIGMFVLVDFLRSNVAGKDAAE